MTDKSALLVKKAFEDWAWEKAGMPIGHYSVSDATKIAFFAGAEWASAQTSTNEPLTIERLDKLQFGRSLHERPRAQAAGVAGREEIANALFARYCEQVRARGHDPHHPAGTPVNAMPPSYRDDYLADADAILTLTAQPPKLVLSKDERFLLEWLSKEDSSAYGECHGRALDALIGAELAKVSGTPPDGFSRVSLTDAGWAAFKSLTAEPDIDAISGTADDQGLFAQPPNDPPDRTDDQINVAAMPSVEAMRVAIADGFNNGYQQYEDCNAMDRMRFDAAARAVAVLAAQPAPRDDQNPLRQIIDAWDRFRSDDLQLDEGFEQAIEAGRAVLACSPATTVSDDDWKDDPGTDERWIAGCDFAMLQVCNVFGVDPHSVNWDAATETLDGDVCAVIGNIMRAGMGEDFDPQARPSPQTPEGWKLVPIEPTIDQHDAAMEFALGHMRAHGVTELSPFKDYPPLRGTTAGMYRAMLNAAPRPPSDARETAE